MGITHSCYTQWNNQAQKSQQRTWCFLVSACKKGHKSPKFRVRPDNVCLCALNGSGGERAARQFWKEDWPRQLFTSAAVSGPEADMGERCVLSVEPRSNF